jgi:transcriptional regulator with XRE-family HTH domain
MIVSPLMSRLRLGAAIRDLRDQRGLTGAELGEQAGIGRVAVSRIERAERRTRISVVMRILEVLGLPEDGPEYRTLVRVARAAEERGWWESAAYAAMGDRQARTADIECGATLIREYQPTMLPGLLQTESYARFRAEALLAEGDSFDLDATLRGRLRRQHQLTEPGSPRYEAIVEELAIRRLVVPPEVMREQLTHLLDLVSTGAVTIRVLPVDARLEAGSVPRSPFSVYAYAADDPLLVAVDTVTEDLLVTDQEHARRYLRVYERLAEVARSAAETRVLISQVVEQLATVSVPS